MSIFVSNFGRHLGDWLKQNRARLLKAALVVALALLVGWLLYLAIEKWHAWQFEKKAQALEQQIRDERQKAKTAEAQAQVLALAIESKYTQLSQMEGRAKAAEDALRAARFNSASLKQTYETVRYITVPDACVSRASACESLAAVGYACQ